MPKNSKGDITKLALRKAIESGKIKAYEINHNSWIPTDYTLIDPTTILKAWDGFHYSAKYDNPTKTAWASFGTSFKFKIA